MDTEIQKYKKMYPNLDVLMIETILKMTQDQHQKFQAGLESEEMCPAPEKFVYDDAIEIINSSAVEEQTDDLNN